MREIILASNRGDPKGYALFRAFLQEVDSGVIPETKTTSALADAFERILFDRADPIKELRLKRGRGERKPISARDQEKHDRPYCDFIWSQIVAANHKRGAQSSAIAAAAEHFKGKAARSERQLETIWARNKPFYEALRYVEKMAALWKKHITTEEWERLKDGPATEIDRLALSREKALLTKSK